MPKSQKYQIIGKHGEMVRGNAARHVASLSLENDWIVEIKPYKRARTDPQNRALFGVAYPVISEATGFTLQEIHDFMCIEYFGGRDVQIGNRAVTFPLRSTTRNEEGRRDLLTTEQFSEFYGHVQYIAAEGGIHVPDPEKEPPKWL